MLSNPNHRYSYDGALPVANMIPNGHIPSNHMPNPGLDTLAHGSQYALQQLQRQINGHQNTQQGRNSIPKHRQHPYNTVPEGANPRNNGVAGTSTSGPVRRRISRACDQCNQLRTKCDGQSPCAHCVGMCYLHLFRFPCNDKVLEETTETKTGVQ
jgi:hypothetical protein